MSALHLNNAKFSLGQSVSKKSGSQWRGKIVGFYSTSLTPIGYCVESANEPGSVQIYPESALQEWNRRVIDPDVEALVKAGRALVTIVKDSKHFTRGYINAPGDHELHAFDDALSKFNEVK